MLSKEEIQQLKKNRRHLLGHNPNDRYYNSKDKLGRPRSDKQIINSQRYHFMRQIRMVLGQLIRLDRTWTIITKEEEQELKQVINLLTKMSKNEGSRRTHLYKLAETGILKIKKYGEIDQNPF